MGGKSRLTTRRFLRHLTCDLLIRDPARAEFDQWHALWDQYNAFYGRQGATALSDEIVQTTWDRFFDPHESVHCLVAEVEGQLVGLAHFLFHRNTITIEHTCYLQDLFADPMVRGRGIGRALISAFQDRARQAGAVEVYWHTHETNHTARQLYDDVATNTGFLVYRNRVTDGSTC